MTHAAEQLGGHHELLQQLLERFLQDFVPAPGQLRAALEQFEPTIRLAHTLGAGTLQTWTDPDDEIQEVNTL